jgi:divalent metal cation (Fe/Co/Zn/Cd) transporter
MTISVKLWLGKFNKYLGKAVDSSIILASGTDALNDVLMSSSVVISLLLIRLFNINLDAYFGIGISLFIIYAGIGIAKDVMIPLLGAKPSKELIQSIKNIVLEEGYVTNVHDVIINNYGYGKDIISLHIEVPQGVPSTEIYKSVTSIEQKISEKYKSLVIIQADLTNADDMETVKIKMKVLDICNRFDYIHKIQDFRIIKNTIIFDVVLEDDYADITKGKIENDLNSLIKDYKVKINQISREGTYI